MATKYGCFFSLEGSLSGTPTFTQTLQRGVELMRFRVESLVNAVAYSTDGTRIVSGLYDQSVRVWDATTGEQFRVLEGHTKQVTSVGFWSDRGRIVSGSDDQSVQVWDLTTGEKPPISEDHTISVNSVNSSNDGRKIVSCALHGSAFHPHSHPYVREKVDDAHTGWIMSPQSYDRLMFVPLSATLPDYSNILTLPTHLLPTLDFSFATLGSQWHGCYSP